MIYVEGAELSWSQLWHPQWRSQLSASWLRATYDQGFTSTIAANSVPVPAGNRLPGIPQQQLFASVQWAQNGFSSNPRQGANGWSSSLDWLARSSLWASDVNDAVSRVPGYGVVNLKVRHRSNWGAVQLEAWAGIDNLGNRQYVGSVIVNQAGGQYFEPSLPRQWMLGLKGSVPF